MKKSILLLLVFSLAPGAGALYAESWACNYHGTWNTNGSGNSGKLEWEVTWVKQGNGWTVLGNMEDKYGASTVNGSCQNARCSFTQTYSTGSLVGKPYVYTGTYTDNSTGDGESENTFTGTWSGNGATGTWTARAVCTRN